jgi:hypothetical protein
MKTYLLLTAGQLIAIASMFLVFGYTPSFLAQALVQFVFVLVSLANWAVRRGS